MRGKKTSEMIQRSPALGTLQSINAVVDKVRKKGQGSPQELLLIRMNARVGWQMLSEETNVRKE